HRAARLSMESEVPAQAAPGTGILGALDGFVDRLTQLVAAFLVLVEVVILFCGVIWRYGLDHPLVWVEELAGILFLWLVSLGAVIALRRGEHMRMTVILGRLPPRGQRFALRLAALIVAVVTLCLLIPGISYAIQQQAILTPVM